ncbi:MAG: DUF362 domain-containing protein [Promethearchaeota archaeon]
MEISNLLSIRKIVEDDVESAVFQALEDVRAEKLFPNEDMKVLLKPNVLSGKPPERAVTTHPSVIKAIIHWLKKFNPAEIYVGDSSGGKNPNTTKKALIGSGIQAVCDEEEVICIPFEKTERIIYNVSNPLILDKFASTNLLKDVDVIIDLPKIKTHELTMLTCSIKNMFGTVILFNKAKLHAKYTSVHDFTSALVDIYSVSKPHLILVDGFLCQEGRGPAAGDVVKMDLIIAGYDGIAIDTLVCKIIGLDPAKVLYLEKGEKQGIGTTHLEDFTMIGESVESVHRQFKLPNSISKGLRLPRKFADYIGKTLVKSKIDIDLEKCILCGKCWTNCPVEALTSPEKMIKGISTPNWNSNKCISCYCCTELCPQEAIEFKINPIKNLLLSKIGLGIGITLSIIIVGIILAIVL